MDLDADPTIGDRLRRFRRLQRLTQVELAERAGVSVDLVSQLERNVKRSALLTTLSRLARALDVNVSVLLSDPVSLPVAADDGGVVALRRALLVDPAAPDATINEVEAASVYAWGCYWSARYDVMVTVVPDLVAAARATAATTGTPRAHAALSAALGVAGALLVHLGHVDLAFAAMERSRLAADESGDGLRSAAAVSWQSWVALHQTGLTEHARALVIERADAIEPKISKATPAHIAVWGNLLISAAVASARMESPDEADELLTVAEAAVTRLGMGPGEVRKDYETNFGMPSVVMQQVDVAVVTDRGARALELARKIPPDSALSVTSQARHAADRAAANVSLGRSDAAVADLLSIERMAPEYLHVQQYPRTLVKELLRVAPRATGLPGLARRVDIT